MTGQTREESLNWLETERIPSASTYLVSLRVLRNQKTPVGSLPPELLLEIFLILSSDCRYEQSHARRWSHVCSQWRSVVVSTSSLWSQVDLANLDLAQLALERCRGSPLVIFFKESRDDETTPWAEVDMHKCKVALHSRLDRIERVSLESSLGISIDLMGIFKPLPPRLRDLSITITPHRSSNAAFKRFNRTAVSLPLENLEVDGILAQFNLTTYNNLTSLKLHNQLSRVTNMETLLEILGSCSKLESLDLRFAGPTLPPGTQQYPAPMRSKVELPHLEVATIEDESLVIGYILAHIHIPATALLTLKFSNHRGIRLMELIPRIFPLDRRHFHHLTGVTWFKYQTEFESEVRFTLNNLSIKLYLDQKRCRPDDEDIEEHIVQFMLPFLNQFSLDKIEKVELVCSHYQSYVEAEWALIIPRLEALKTLVYSHWQDYPDEDLHLCNYLVGHEPIVCPGLQTLELHGLHFEKLEGYYEGVAENVIGRKEQRRIRSYDIGKQLAECLRTRENLGSRLTELKITEAHCLSTEATELLESCADHVSLHRFELQPPSKGLSFEEFEEEEKYQEYSDSS